MRIPFNTFYKSVEWVNINVFFSLEQFLISHDKMKIIYEEQQEIYIQIDVSNR